MKKHCSGEDPKQFCVVFNSCTESKKEETKSTFCAKVREYIGKVANEMKNPLNAQRCLCRISISAGVERMNEENRRYRLTFMFYGYV